MERKDGDERREANGRVAPDRSKRLRRVSCVLALLSAAPLFLYFYTGIAGAANVAGKTALVRRFLLLFLFVALSYAAARIRLSAGRRETETDGFCRANTAQAEAKRVLFPLFALYFALYLHLLLTLTLLDPSLGRDLVYAENSRAYYLEWYVNLRPFRTIWNVYLVGGLGKGLLSHASILINLVGNLAMLMPLAVFLPFFFRPMRRFFVFLPTVVGVTILIETLQFCFMRGSCDVDDLLLNAGGAALFFLFLKIPPVRRFAGLVTAGFPILVSDKDGKRDGGKVEND